MGMLHDRPKILVVDDDMGMRLTLEGIIEDEGYSVLAAEDGYQALELAKSTPFALIFMDIRMPGMSGVETYRRIKEVSPGSVVVMMTGFSVEDLIKEALEEGPYAVLYKPLAVEQIIDILQTVLKTTFVLVVDDRATDRMTLCTILEDRGYNVFEATDGLHALALAGQRHYDVILMDIRMPGMDGVTTLEEIKKIDPKVKVIFITGYDLENPVREALLKGAHTVMTKPVDPEKLLTLVNSLAQREGPE